MLQGVVRDIRAALKTASVRAGLSHWAVVDDFSGKEFPLQENNWGRIRMNTLAPQIEPLSKPICPYCVEDSGFVFEQFSRGDLVRREFLSEAARRDLLARLSAQDFSSPRREPHPSSEG